MKTLFIPVYHGMCTRNLFLTEMLPTILKQPDLRAVCFIPPLKKDFFAKEYGHFKNVIFELVDRKHKKNKLEFIFDFITKSFLNTQAKKSLQLIEYSSDRNKLRYLLGRLLARVFSGSRVLRNLMRWLDYLLVSDTTFGPYFDKYQPNLVFVTDVLSPADTLFLKQAKRKKVPKIAMVRGWDNLTSKGVVRLKPDKIIVQTDLMKREAIEYADMKDQDISISGVPIFDYYVNYQPSAKEDFYKKIGVRPEYKIILFAPFFSHYQDSVKEIIKHLDESINKGLFEEKLKILVRLPPSYNQELGDYISNDNIIYDRPGIQFPLNSYRKDWEFTKKDMQHLADSIHYSSVTSNFASTMTVDSAALDKPIINIDFDAKSHDPTKISIRYIYKNDHYQPVLAANCLKMARSKAELVEQINYYLKHPESEKDGRSKILKELVWKFDGRCSQRVGNYVLDYLNSL